MKKTVFVFALLMIALVSCNNIERTEKRLANEMMSEDVEKSAEAYDEFVHWLKNDRATMTHDFSVMKEKLGLKVSTTPDGKLRSYSWVSGGNEVVKMYSNVYQWVSGKDFIGYDGPIDKLLAGRKADIKKQSSLAHSVDTLFQINKDDQTIYLIMQSYKNANGFNRAYVSATYIDGIVLRLLPFFFDGVEIAGNNVFHNDNYKVSDLFKWDPKTGRFYAYQTDENDNLIPGKYTVYQLGEEQFTRLPENNP